MIKIPMVHMKNATVGRANVQSATYLTSCLVGARCWCNVSLATCRLTSCAIFVCNTDTGQDQNLHSRMNDWNRT